MLLGEGGSESSRKGEARGRCGEGIIGTNGRQHKSGAEKSFEQKESFQGRDYSGYKKKVN